MIRMGRHRGNSHLASGFPESDEHFDRPRACNILAFPVDVMVAYRASNISNRRRALARLGRCSAGQATHHRLR